MYQPTSSTQGWLTPDSLAALQAVADHTALDTGERLRALARRLCADVHARGGSAVDVVVAVKSAWSSARRSTWPVPQQDAERLARLVSLCIDEYYGASR